MSLEVYSLSVTGLIFFLSVLGINDEIKCTVLAPHVGVKKEQKKNK